MTPTPHGQVPKALRIADEFKLCSEYDSKPSIIDIEKAEAELRRLHAENVTLQQGYDAARLEIDSLQSRVQELGAMLRTNCSKRIVELEAQLEAIGAGGVEPLRRRECLHQIVEPAPAGEYPPLPEPDATTVGLGAVWNRHSMRAHVDAARALLAQAAPQQDPSHTAVQLAELVLSDCGHSSNYTPLLDRVAARFDSHVERRLDELRRCLESKPAPRPPRADTRL